MTGSDSRADSTSALVADEIAVEQAHVDLVYAELAKAGERAGLVEADGLARGRTDRVGSAREEEMTGLFERDALVFHAARRRNALESQYEGLVFGRLDIDHPPKPDTDGGPEREIRYIGRLGVRDDDYEPLVIDWRAPAASPFYRATPVEPMGVLRRGAALQGLRRRRHRGRPHGRRGAGRPRRRGRRRALMALHPQPRYPDARHRRDDPAPPGRGDPGQRPWHHRDHRRARHWQDRRRPASGRLPALQRPAPLRVRRHPRRRTLGRVHLVHRTRSAVPRRGDGALRSLGDVVDAVSTERLDTPAAAAIKGGLRIRQVLSRAVHDAVPDGPDEFRAFVAGQAVRLNRQTLDQVRSRALRQHQRNLAHDTVVQLLADAAYRQSGHTEREEFVGRFEDHLEVATFLEAWWPQLDPREVLLWLADEERLTRYAKGILDADEAAVLLSAMRVALDTGTWSVADVALVDDLAARLGRSRTSLARSAATRSRSSTTSRPAVSPSWAARPSPTGSSPHTRTPTDSRERLLQGRIGRSEDYAHVLVDEAQDLSPMQWRMLGRRGRYASWTVVGDAAQSSWPDAAESAVAREEAFGTQPRRLFHMVTNYRNAREIFDYAAVMIRRSVPDADIPIAVRETGVEPGRRGPRTRCHSIGGAGRSSGCWKRSRVRWP